MAEATRRRRVTYSQLEILWEFLNSNKDVAIGYNKSCHARATSRRKWEEVTQALNSCGDGAFKTWKGWSVYWTDYKGKLKKRNAANIESQNRTGGGPAEVTPLTELEKKILQILGDNYGSGLPGIRVDPFADSSSHSPSTSAASQMLQELPQTLELDIVHDANELTEDANPRILFVHEQPQLEAGESPVIICDVRPSTSFAPVDHSVAATLAPALVASALAVPAPAGALIAPVPAPAGALVAPAPVGGLVEPAPEGALVAPAPADVPVAPGPAGAPAAPAEQHDRRQRRRRARFTQEEARRALVETSRLRAETEARNSQTLMEMAQSLHADLTQINFNLERIARRIDPDN